jgi:drug/metabolite transporter (DMT)-like permease
LERQSLSQAGFWMAGWLLLTLATTVSGRELAHDVPVVVLMLLRSLTATALLAPIILATGGLKNRMGKLGFHAARNGVHYVAQFAWFSALIYIPLAQMVSIEFTLPIWAAIIAWLFLGEKLDAWKILAIVLGFIGVVTIVRPGGMVINIGHAYALFSAFGFAVSVSLTRFLTRTESPLTVIFYMFAMQSVLGAIPAALVWQWPQPHNWIWVAVVGIAGTYSHYCLSKALSLGEIAVVQPLDFLRVPLTALVGYLVYSEGIDMLTALGAALILVANSLNLFRARAS